MRCPASGRVPTKATWIEFETDPAAEFEFYLAERVMHCTVQELRHRMDESEFRRWGVYFGRKSQREEMAAKKGR